MPQTVIAKLRLLMEQPELPTLATGVVYAEGDCPELAEPVYGLLDQIHDAARSVFGGSQPSAAQQHLMEQAGFSVLWRSGLISTPKGKVRYKP